MVGRGAVERFDERVETLRLELAFHLDQALGLLQFLDEVPLVLLRLLPLRLERRGVVE